MHGEEPEISMDVQKDSESKRSGLSLTDGLGLMPVKSGLLSIDGSHVQQKQEQDVMSMQEDHKQVPRNKLEALMANVSRQPLTDEEREQIPLPTRVQINNEAKYTDNVSCGTANSSSSNAMTDSNEEVKKSTEATGASIDLWAEVAKVALNIDPDEVSKIRKGAAFGNGGVSMNNMTGTQQQYEYYPEPAKKKKRLPSKPSRQQQSRMETTSSRSRKTGDSKEESSNSAQGHKDDDMSDDASKCPSEALLPYQTNGMTAMDPKQVSRVLHQQQLAHLRDDYL